MSKVGKWRYLAISFCLMIVSEGTFADSIYAKRQRYQQVKQAWDNDQINIVDQLLPMLYDYPLYPYLEYRRLTQNLSQISITQVNEFLVKNPSLPSARLLPTLFVNELARRQDWNGLLVFSPQPPESITARCNFYYAKWATGEQKIAWEGAHRIWLNGQSQPASCDKLFRVWQQAGHQTPLNTLLRIRLAMEANNTNLVNFLAKQLPTDYQSMSSALVKLQNNLASVEHFACKVGPTDFTRAVTRLAFIRLASQNVEKARVILPTIIRLQKMNAPEHLALEEAVAWHFMGSQATFEQAQWRDSVVSRSRSSALLERRARLALSSGDHQSLAIWLARLPPESRDKDEWRYWYAVLLLDEGKHRDGEAILYNLIQKRGFYPMVAAQRLNIDYPIRVVSGGKPDLMLPHSPAVARVRELVHWGMYNLARREWRYLVTSRSKKEQEALARYAFDQKWADLCVQATIIAKLWDHLEERFPMVWLPAFRRATKGKEITPSYAMAITRQESAWNPNALSPVGASGLMQVVPRTAKHTVRTNNISGYRDSSQLFDPAINIKIGTSYLEEIYQRFDHNRILSTAAYNAGPSRVNRWLEESKGQVDAIAFIESIPFSETRSYVKNVLAYDVFYRYFMRRQTKILSDAEWQRRY